MPGAIRVEGIGKQYTLGRRAGSDTLREAISGVGRRLVGRGGGLDAPGGGAPGDGASDGTAPHRIWALDDVTFEIAPGQAVGIVGANGAGKSTLLKILSRITEPTTGRGWIEGRVGSLLEVGTGFHPELTGRENTYLNGAILGMRRAEIDRRFDEIVAFAEVERFLDTPVKHYSDGMYLRLAFAVAAHLEPEVLLVDEVLAVGDARFQKRCLGKMTEITEGQGRTVLFVSHNMSVIQRLCARSLLLEGGRLVDDGPTTAVVARYLRDQPSITAPDQWIDVSAAPRRGTGEARFRAVRYSSGNEEAGLQAYPDGPLDFVMEIDSDVARSASSFGVVLADRNGTKLVNADILSLGQELRLDAGRTEVHLRIEQLHLNPGIYELTLWLGDTVGVGYDLVEPAFHVEVVALDQAGFGVTPGSEYGTVTSRISVERA